MADVAAIFGVLLALGIAFPGMLTACYLFLPRQVEQAQLRVTRAPWKVFWTGAAAALGLGVPVFILLALPSGVTRFLGWGLLLAALTFSTIGAAALVRRMAEELSARAPALSPAGAFVRAAVALELAAFFPLIGWLVILPAAVLASLGAALLGVLRPLSQPVLPVAAPRPQA